MQPTNAGSYSWTGKAGIMTVVLSWEGGEDGLEQGYLRLVTLLLWCNVQVVSSLLQHAVFYKEEECLGGASVLQAGPLPWEQG